MLYIDKEHVKVESNTALKNIYIKIMERILVWIPYLKPILRKIAFFLRKSS